MIIDRHGHHTTAPQAFSDDDIRASIDASQRRLVTERGIYLTIFSPRASAMEHHVGGEAVSV